MNFIAIPELDWDVLLGMNSYILNHSPENTFIKLA
jgi:hypothetical protein